MSNKGPATFKKAPLSPFKLQKAVESIASPTKSTLRVMTSLPNAEFINSLWELDNNIGKNIFDCLNLVYSHITQRGAHDQGQPHFFHHVAATTLYESYHDYLIKGKDHGKKAGTILNKINNTLTSIERALSTDDKIISEQQKILENFQAELMAHRNALIRALKGLPDDTKRHLKAHQNLDIEALEQTDLTPKKKARVKSMHASPLPKTPKKLSLADRLAQRALQATSAPMVAMPSSASAPLAAMAAAPQLQNPNLMVPPILKRLALKSAFTQVKHKASSTTFEAKENPLDIDSSKGLTFLLNEKMKKLATPPQSPKKATSPSLSPKKIKS
jgi:hypothetical protein